MTYDVKIDARPEEKLRQMHDWIKERGWKHLIDFRWFHPNLPKDKGMYWTFQFEREEDAILFTLRWS